MKPASFEEVLEQVGSSGRHQKLLMYLFVLPLNFLIPWMVLAPIFFTSTPAHHCTPPQPPIIAGAEQPHGSFFPSEALTHPSAVPTNYSVELWKAVAIPRTEGELDQCRQYNVTWEDITAFLPRADDGTNITEMLTGEYGITGCSHGLTFDTSEFTETLPSSMGWVCDHDKLTAMWLSVGLAGNVVGTLVFTTLADIYGRRPLLAVTALVCTIFGSARIFFTSTWAVMAAQFIASTPFPAILELSLIIVLEQVSPDLRSFITSATFMLWTLGMSVLPLLAWLTASWRLLCIVTSLPFAAIAAACWLVPESPSWLLSQGRVAETTRLLTDIARRNGRPVPKDLKEQLSLLNTHTAGEHYGPLQLLQTPTVRRRTMLLTACYTCNNLFYYGLTYNIDNMSGNQFLNFFLFGITEMPANFIGCWLTEVVGRRWSQALAFLLASACALTAIPFLGTGWVATALLTISKMFTTISFLVIYIQCAEIYPTTHRGSGTGLSSLISSCFGTTGPYIAYMSFYWKGIPYMILGSIGCLGIVLSSLLPETLGEDLPQTLEEAEFFLVDQKYFSFKGKRPCGRQRGSVNRADTEAYSPSPNARLRHAVVAGKIPTDNLSRMAGEPEIACLTTVEPGNNYSDSVHSSTSAILSEGSDDSVGH